MRSYADHDTRPYFVAAAEVLDMLPERVIRFSVPSLLVSYCNTAWAEGHGVASPEVIGHRLDQFLSAAELVGVDYQLGRLGPDNPILADDHARPAPDKAGRWVEWVDRYLWSADGAEVIAVGRDVTARYLAELSLAESEARFRNLADSSADVVWRFVLDPTPHFDYMSPAVEHIIGYPPSVFLEDFTQFIDLLDDEGRAWMERALLGELPPERFELRYRHKNGSIVIGEMRTTRIHRGLQGVSRDVTELRALQAELTSLALRDPLTGLANRRLFNELFEVGLARTERAGEALAVAYLDLDGLKQINDRFGHDAGDIVLQETARRLLSVVRSADSVARIGGDEFVVLYEPDLASSDGLILRLDTALSAPIDIGKAVRVQCPASIGHADTNEVARNAVLLLAAADADMYVAKRARRSLRRARVDAAL